MSAARPATIGRYEIERVIGHGAMGVVYRAHDPVIGRPVAIKLIRADLLGGRQREEYLTRFRREAQAAGRCIHPHIVTVFDFALHEGNPYLAMEHIEGISLDAATAPGERLPPADAVTIILQVLEALDCAHGLGVIHRDIKPANIILQASGHVKVMDFGVARVADTSTTADGAMIGTPSYMAPEQCRGQAVDARADLYSAGAMLFEMLSGQKPFPGTSFAEVITQLLHDPAPSLGPLLPPAQAALAAAVDRALLRDPASRYAAARDMATALRTAFDGTVPAAPAIASRQPAPPITTLDEHLLQTLHRHLAEHIGPIARVLVGQAAHQATDFDTLCGMLAARIDAPKAREAFLSSVRRELAPAGASLIRNPAASTAGASSQTAIPQPVIDQAQRALTAALGPIAPVLIKRALPRCPTPEALWSTLAERIENEADRRAFLATRPKP